MKAQSSSQPRAQVAPLPSLEQLEQLYGFLTSASPKGESHGGNDDKDTCMTSASTSTSSNESLHQPLTGRKVMIPITTKGFFEGTLNPSIRTSSSKPTNSSKSTTSISNQNGDVGNEQEQVLTTIGEGYMAEMTTDEASKYIARRMDAIRLLMTKESKTEAEASTKSKASSDSKPMTEKKKKNKLKMKKGFLQSTTTTRTSTSSSKKKSSSVPSRSASSPIKEPLPSQQQHSRKPQAAIAAPSLPFMEIREEYDKEGNEIKAEALDVSKELQKLHRTIQSKKKDGLGGIGGGGGGGGIHSESNILDTLAESVPKHLSSDDDNETDRETSKVTANDEGSSLSEIDEPKPQPRPYEEITARLDELILLEESEAKRKADNVKSSKAIQGSGWKKGFFSSSSNKDSQEKKTKTKAKKKVTMGQTTASPTSPNAAQMKIPVPSSSISERKSVQFGKNEIKEIPRIGTRSVNDIMTPGAARKNTFTVTNTSSAMNNGGLVSNTPEPETSTRTSLGQTQLGVTTEKMNEVRRSVNNPVSLGGIVERPRVANSDTNTNESDQQPKKKLSRFAQRRQQQR